MNKFNEALNRIDEKNSEDPHKELADGKTYPKELLYSERMTKQLLEFKPEASEELQIAARAQHICRWQTPREDYPMTRVGYLNWRNDLKKEHAEITAEILKEVGYDQDFIDRVSFLVQKKKIKKDAESQILEDVICLVFLQYYLDDFEAKLKEDHKEDKMLDIIRKTWAKMSAEGHEAALKLALPDKAAALVNRALS
ncbi:DUF4202 domain-containing protein [Antarcticibacterium sp. 1MA-6-2]|uniref:DUF4202 domain-containing protein n=1 Tax=Antarcticibacterium sp. 1MA-6-2 TaxID=2908210 RepID=UPI001F30C928|nr:DUF4202 domain-containing protein [Antarcticibacterium sp. 1MA-6-2]UJH89647.1 DUF4202 domain-containing protein [Antarcticibacterium sp. 1MA-6-2]